MSDPASGQHRVSVSDGQVLPPYLLPRLETLGVQLGNTLQANGKSVVCNGAWSGRPVIVKAVDPAADQQWQDRHAAEQTLHARMRTSPPPVRTAELLHAEEHLTILEHLDGTMLHPDRYPGPLDRQAVARVLDTLERLHSWAPPPDLPGPPQHITVSYVDRKHAAGVLTDHDRQLLLDWLPSAARWPMRIEHGDPWSSNFLIPVGPVGVLDWEHAGWHVPGYDWALISLVWTPANPWLHELLQARLSAEGIELPFAVNLLLLAGREWTMHADAGPDLFAQVAPVLQENLVRAREHLHATFTAARPGDAP